MSETRARVAPRCSRASCISSQSPVTEKRPPRGKVFCTIDTLGFHCAVFQCCFTYYSTAVQYRNEDYQKQFMLKIEILIMAVVKKISESACIGSFERKYYMIQVDFQALNHFHFAIFSILFPSLNNSKFCN